MTPIRREVYKKLLFGTQMYGVEILFIFALGLFIVAIGVAIS